MPRHGGATGDTQSNDPQAMPERNHSPRLSRAPDAATMVEEAWPKPLSLAVILAASAGAWGLVLLALLV